PQVGGQLVEIGPVCLAQVVVADLFFIEEFLVLTEDFVLRGVQRIDAVGLYLTVDGIERVLFFLVEEVVFLLLEQRPFRLFLFEVLGRSGRRFISVRGRGLVEDERVVLRRRRLQPGTSGVGGTRDRGRISLSAPHQRHGYGKEGQKTQAGQHGHETLLCTTWET